MINDQIKNPNNQSTIGIKKVNRKIIRLQLQI
jgi:hypothetical protein